MDQLFAWPRDMVGKLFGGSLPEFKHLVVTSEFSGMGTAELAVVQIVSALNAQGGPGAWQVRVGVRS